MSKKVKKLQNENNELYLHMNLENQGIYMDMIHYIRGRGVFGYNLELAKRDLMEVVLSAEERGEKTNNVVGEDFKDFCDNLIANLPPNTVKEKILIYLNVFCIGLSIFGMLGIVVSKNTYSLFQGLLAQETVNYNMPITLGMLMTAIIMLIFAVIIVEAMITNQLKNEKNFMVIVIIISTFVLTAKFGKTVIFTVNIFVAIGVVVGLFIIHKLLNKV